MKRGMYRGLLLVAALGLAGGEACGNAEASGATPSSSGEDSPSAPQGQGAPQGRAAGQAGAQPEAQGGVMQAGAGTCSPEQLAALHRAFFAAESDRARMALGSAEEAVVRQYAQETLDEYKKLMDELSGPGAGGQTAGDLPIGRANAQPSGPPEASDVAGVLAAMEQQSLAALKASTQFDRDYLASEIVDYATMLGFVDMLRSGMCSPAPQPGAGSPEQAAAMIDQARQAIQRHLQALVQLESQTLGNYGGGAGPTGMAQ